MGQTRVDLLHLLEDLRDAYPGSLEETIVAETVANALDSGARNVAFEAHPSACTLTISDDGAGMTGAQLRRYHDLAATSKRRGHGIGFAGVVIKLALLACEEVVTESRRGGRAHATSWHLASRHRAPWRWIATADLAPAPSGTAVLLRLSNALSQLLEPGWLATTLLRHFAPLFDPSFDDILRDAYARGVLFSVNGRQVPRASLAHVRILGDARLLDRATIIAKLLRKRRPSASGWIVRADAPLPEEERGVAIATLGKVIKRGWDWLGVTPSTPDRISGLVEAPGLAEALTLNKSDFIRTGARGATYLAYRKAIQEAATTQLAAWGDAPEPAPARRPRTRRIERDLEDVLLGLADDFPLLGMLVERRRGGQKRIPFGDAAGAGGPLVPGASIQVSAERRSRKHLPAALRPPHHRSQTPDAPRTRSTSPRPSRRATSRPYRRPRARCPGAAERKSPAATDSRSVSRRARASRSSRASSSPRSGSTTHTRPGDARSPRARRATTSR